MEREPLIVGIGGGSAAGKSTFIRELQHNIKEHITVISQDNYYFPITQQPKDLNGIENFDTPESIDSEALLKDLKDLKNHQAVSRQEYTFNNPGKQSNLLHYSPSPVIVLEGIFIFYYVRILEILDLRIYLDVKEHLKLSRRIMRDKIERGYDLEDVLYRYENHVVPSYERFIEPSKYHAHMIIPNNHEFKVALEVVSAFIESKLKNR